ncbi:hypothetical protein LWI29_021933 [Acer saccharum]|uniref:Retrotransposon Copia-like N-terminal domain-containing protein n=1 Tax=Acer saccharum TaxID=4024 RepID=A0AA39VN05_ACESA|nr:hypothetical protein LWI29_021933 [Acer saccharum]
MTTNSSSSISSSSEPSTSINNGGSGNGGSEHPHPTHMSITSHKLNGHNYLPWSQSVMMFICGKGKDDFVTGVAESPGVELPAYKQWKTDNSMVMSWLINSMTNDIGENFLFMGQPRKSGMLPEIRIPVVTTWLNYLESKAYSMTFVKEIAQSLNTTTT